jgi:low affinity Fe/Cu permease
MKKSGLPSKRFNNFAKSAAHWAGRSSVFLAMLILVAAWAAAGPIFHFSEGWQLTINTATTIVTFLMVFIIQNTQNRDTEALQLKLDELIRITKGAHNALLNIEDLSEEELDEIKGQYELLAARALSRIRRGQIDGDTPSIDLSKPPKR